VTTPHRAASSFFSRIALIGAAAIVSCAGAEATLASSPLRLFWTDRAAGQIQAASLDGSDVETIVAGLPGPQGVAVDPVGGRLYWADTTEGAIRSSFLDGSDQILVRAGVGFPTGVDVDPIGRMVYWCDPVFGHIQRAPIGPGQIETILTGLSVPQDLVADPASGRLYVAAGNVGIFSATLNGDDLSLLTPSFDGQSVTLDLSATRCTLFWGAAGRLTSAPVGGGEGDGLPPITGGVTGLALDPSGSIFWAEDGPVFRYDPDAGAAPITLLPPAANAWRLAIGPEVAAPTIRTPPSSQVVVAGGSAIISVEADGSGPLTYQWRRDGAALTNAASVAGVATPTLTISLVGLGDIGVYDCVISGPGGSIVSPPAVLGVRPTCEGDLATDGWINSQDLSALLALWGPCPPSPGAPADATPGVSR
jgi:hypothetical protein